VPAKLNTDKIADTITPIATRVASDPEVRDAAKSVLDSAKTVLEKVQANGAKSAAADKKVQDEVVKAAKELQRGVAKATAKPKASKKKKVAKAAAVGAVAVGTVVVAKKALSKDEDEFEYTP
jgi:preprotein translocase subunit Sss1